MEREDWLTAKRGEVMDRYPAHYSISQFAADMRFAAWLEQVANPFDPRAASSPVAQPNWAALGLGSHAEAEGRN